MLVGDFGKLTTFNLLLIIWIMVGIAIVFVMMRSVIRCYVFHHDDVRSLIVYVASDACVYLALVTLISMAILYSLVMRDIFEVDRVTAGQENPAPGFLQRGNFFLRCQFALICLFWTSIWSVKISILLFYKILFEKLQAFKICWWLVLGVVCATYLACWGTQLASCWPIPTYFNLGSCDSGGDTDRSNDSLYVTAAIDIFSDSLMMVLLLSLLYGLRTDRKQKLAVAAIFSLSLIVIIIAVIRAIEIRASTDHVDPVWLALWSMIEGSVGELLPRNPREFKAHTVGSAVIAACLPSFRIFLSARERTISSYKRRNPLSSGHSDAQVRSPNPRGSTIRLQAMQTRAYVDVESGDIANASHDHITSVEATAPPNTTISTSSKTESLEDILPTIPKDRILKRQDVVSAQPLVQLPAI